MATQTPISLTSPPSPIDAGMWIEVLWNSRVGRAAKGCPHLILRPGLAVVATELAVGDAAWEGGDEARPGGGPHAGRVEVGQVLQVQRGQHVRLAVEEAHHCASSAVVDDQKECLLPQQKPKVGSSWHAQLGALCMRTSLTCRFPSEAV